MPNHDIAIIGGGASGLAAAAAAAKAGLSTVVIDRMGGGGELMNLGALEDLADSLTGPDLSARLLEEAVTAGAELAIAEVTGLIADPAGWRVVTDDQTHIAAIVILATGLAPGTLGLDNEPAFEGMGLSHCATCDAPLFRDQPVVVAGADRWARLEAHELTAYASAVTLVTQGETGQTATGGVMPALDGVTVIEGRIVALDGAGGLDAVTVRPVDGGAAVRLPAQGVFVQTGRRPALGFAPDALARDADGRVAVDAAWRTNLPGVFAVGDARGGSPRTLAAAMEDARRVVRSVTGR